MGTVKKLLLAVALSVPGVLRADEIVANQYFGLNNNSSPPVIDVTEAQDLLNTDVSITGNSFKKRDGFGVYKNLGASAGVRGGHHFFDSSGNDVQVWGSSVSLWGIVGGATPTQLVSSATVRATWDCADTQGNAYCVNSSRDAFIKTNGTTMTWYTTPLGTMVEATPDRIIVAGVSGTPNTIYVSQSNTFTNYTSGLAATDPFTEPIASPGSHLTQLRSACGKVLWWKDQSFGSMDFEDQFSVEIKIISDTIGTFDNTSAIDPGGNIWFRGQDGHIYRYDCSFLTKETIPITPNVQASGSRTSNSWVQTSQSDFQAGFSFALDSTTTPGALTLNRFSDSFADLSNWTRTGPFSVSGGVVRSSFTAMLVSVSTRQLTDTFYVAAQVKIEGPTNTAWIGAVTATNTGVLAYVQNNGAGNFVAGTGSYDGATFGLFSGGVSVGTPDTNYHTLGIRRFGSNGQYSVYWDGVLVESKTSLVYGTVFTKGFIAVTASPAAYINFDDFSMSASTGTFYSAVHNSPNLSAWDTLGTTKQDDGGSHTFSVRASSNSYTILSTTPTWTSVNAGSLITASTGTFIQFSDAFAITSSSSVPTLFDVTLNWFEGTATDQAYMEYFDNAIWSSVAFGSGQTANNYIFKCDLLRYASDPSKSCWTLYNFGAGGFLVQNNVLYFGSPSTGDVFNFGTVTSDNGTAINAYRKSKEFSGPDPFMQNQLSQIDTFAKKDQGTTLTTTYITDGITSTSYSVSLSTGGVVAQSRKLLPSGKLGYTFNIQYGDTSTSSSWEVFGYRIMFSQLPYRVTP